MLGVQAQLQILCHWLATGSESFTKSHRYGYLLVFHEGTKFSYLVVSLHWDSTYVSKRPDGTRNIVNTYFQPISVHTDLSVHKLRRRRLRVTITLDTTMAPVVQGLRLVQ